MKKAAFILALAMLLGVAAGCGQSAGEASVQSVSMICGLGSAGMTDRFAGVVSALGETNIKKDDSMTIGEIKVKAGDAVNVGDVLFTYDMSQLEIDLEDAQLSLEELKSQRKHSRKRRSRRRTRWTKPRMTPSAVGCCWTFGITTTKCRRPIAASLKRTATSRSCRRTCRTAP